MILEPFCFKQVPINPKTRHFLPNMAKNSSHSTMSPESSNSVSVIVLTSAPNLNSSNYIIPINTTSQLPSKLNKLNYTSWRVQFQSLLFGYDLLGYIDGTYPCPPFEIHIGAIGFWDYGASHCVSYVYNASIDSTREDLCKQVQNPKSWQLVFETMVPLIMLAMSMVEA